MTVAPQFINVGSEDDTITLKELVPTAEDPELLSDAIQMQGLDSVGSTDYSNTYDWSDGKWWLGAKDASNDKISVAQGFFIVSTVGDAARIQCSGQVNEKAITIPLDTDFGGVTAGNSYPMGIPLKNFVPTAEDPDMLSDSIQMQGLDTVGSTDYSNTYDWSDGKWWLGSEDASEHIVKPGEAFFIVSTVGDVADLVITPPAL